MATYAIFARSYALSLALSLNRLLFRRKWDLAPTSARHIAKSVGLPDDVIQSSGVRIFASAIVIALRTKGIATNVVQKEVISKAANQTSPTQNPAQ